ncbi:MAG: hypothetical protein U0132_02305 [Gemmatimonadaceae bacterium]
MALAILRPSRVPGSPGAVAFALELGSNRFFQYAVGDDTVTRDSGFPMLGATQFTSPIVGPLPVSAMGRTTFEVPADRFDRDHRTVQVTSYRTKAREGPAVSDIVRVAVVPRGREDFPTLSFSLRDPMDPYSIDDDGYGAATNWRGPVPMSYREVPPVSTAMFLGSILPVLGGLVSKAMPVLKGLVGGGGGDIGGMIGSLLGGAKAPQGGGGGGGGGGTAVVTPPGLETLLKPETVQLIMQFLQQLQAGGAGGTPQAKSLAASAPEYSRAAIAPALLAALPALAPLLEKVLNPETIKAVLDHTDPSKIIGAVTDSMKEIGKLGLDHDKQENEHLRALNPMGVHAPVDDLLKEMGFASAVEPGVTREKGEPAYRRVESVKLTFAGASPVMIHGRSRVCYRAGDEIAFPFDLETPRPVSDARLTLMVKNPATRKILARRMFTIPQASTGRITVRTALTKEDTKGLAQGEEYLVCAYLVWKNAKQKVIGTSRSQLITLIGEYIFDRVEEGTVVPLNDVAKFRPFWHKVWQGSFTTDFFKVDFEGKYYYVLEPTRASNAPIETTTNIPDDKEKVRKGRLKSGMNTSLGALNALIPLVSTGKPLNEAQLGALGSSDFVSRFNSAARFNATLSGKSGLTAAIWAYPEVKLQQVVLFKAASTDADSHVRELTEERVPFPIPVTLHVIGARTSK